MLHLPQLLENKWKQVSKKKYVAMWNESSARDSIDGNKVNNPLSGMFKR